MKDLRYLSIKDLKNALARGEIRSQDVLETFLSYIRNDTLNAFISVASDGTAVEKAERCKKGCNSEQVLYAIPLALKDNISTKNFRTTCASKMLENYIPPFNATVTEKLESAGAVILGKTNMDEFAMGSTGENSFFNLTKNPWDETRVAGGSGSGSAAAVAAGLVPCALGSDTGGSIRQPAAFCGVSGIKPTYGRVSRHGLVAYASSLDQIGVVARSVEDLALVTEVISGHDCHDATSSQRAVPDYSTALKKQVNGIRLGLPREYFKNKFKAETDQALKNALNEFRKLGLEIVDIELPHTEYAVSAYYIIACAEAASNLNRYDGVRYGQRIATDDLEKMYVKSRSEGFGREVKRRILMGTYILSRGFYERYYLQAQKMRRLVANDFQQAFRKCDCIFAPVTPSTAFKIGEMVSPLEMYLQDIYTLPVNLAGLPAMSIPCGFDNQGLPIGMQLIADKWQEEELFAVGQAYQSVTDWHKHFCF